VTVHGSERVEIRLSPELLGKIRAVARGHHVSMSESVRLALQVMVNSPGDTVNAMFEDPEAARVEFVERVEVPAKSSATKVPA
jgi:Arc/MetJ-type ribon-helix-helix transcriptional regulator